MWFTTSLYYAFFLVPVIAAVVILRRRNRVEPRDRAPGIIYLTQLVGVVAAGWGAVVAINQSVLAFQPLTAVHALASVAPFQPWDVRGFPREWDSPETYLMFVDIDQVRVAVAQADVWVRLLQAVGNVLMQVPTITIGVFVVILCGRIIHGVPFAATLVKLSWIGAGVFVLTGFAGQLLSGLAAFQLANVAFEFVRAEHPVAELPTPIWPGPLDWWPLWGALALAVLAVLIRHGARLQKDTEGLV
ncbi:MULTISPECIES: hypothetical protein [unclassified Microbacterium]|uniref:hypothetical protein n=1 Tax=unclassified Microbacterium TaxID=2609290 RepID=UPI002CAD99B7|nr:hypothetical protein [Microbacterium sp.]HWK78842.1 hypothetical protein [Microbacterium sp.]